MKDETRFLIGCEGAHMVDIEHQISSFTTLGLKK